MKHERSIQLENISKVIVDEVHGDFNVQGWERPDARVEWHGDLQMHQENGVLFLQFPSEGQLHLPHLMDLNIQVVHGDLQIANVQSATTLHEIHGDLRLQQMGVVHAQAVHGDMKVNQIVGPLAIETVDGDLEVQSVSDTVTVNSVDGDARLHTVGALSAGSIQGDLTLREARGTVQVESVGGDLHTSHLHGDCRTAVGGDLKAGHVSGNLECTVGGDAVLRVEQQSGQGYRIHAGGDITCRLSVNAGVAINANSGGEIHVRQLPIQVNQEIRTLQTVLGDGSAALELTAGGDITLANRERGVEWEFEFNGDFADEIGTKAAAYAEGFAKQVEQQMAHLTRHLDEKFAHFGNEEFAVNIQEKVQSAMQKAEEKIAEAMRRAEQRAREAEARAAEHQARHEERARQHQQHVRPQHMHHPRPGGPGIPPMAPAAPAAPQAPAVSSEERMMILKMLSEGQITVEQADQLLAALGGKVTV